MFDKCNKIVEDVTSRLNYLESDETIPGSIRNQIQVLKAKLILGEVEVDRSRIAKNYLKSDNTSENIGKKFDELASKVATNTTTISGHTQQIADILDRADAQSEELYFLQGKTNILSGDVNTLKETKLNKIFSDVTDAPSIALTDYLVINAGGKAYRVTVEQLQNIISEKTNYYKGQFSSLEQLESTVFPDGLAGGDYAYVDTRFVDENGNVTYQFIMYVWDSEDKHWEETKSTQYLGATTFQAFQESLLNGTFNVGAIKGNVKDISNNSPILKNLRINGTDFLIPDYKNIDLVFSEEHIEGAKSLNSIKFNGETEEELVKGTSFTFPSAKIGAPQAISPSIGTEIKLFCCCIRFVAYPLLPLLTSLPSSVIFCKYRPTVDLEMPVFAAITSIGAEIPVNS